MDPLKTAAQFAAFVWFTNKHRGQASLNAKAHHFAQQNWIGFLPVANEGWGRLLIRLGAPGRAAKKRGAPLQYAVST